jgi:hypothetical protein
MSRLELLTLDEVRHAIANTRKLDEAAAELRWSLSKFFRFRRRNGMGRPVRDRRTRLEVDHAETWTDS